MNATNRRVTDAHAFSTRGNSPRRVDPRKKGGHRPVASDIAGGRRARIVHGDSFFLTIEGFRSVVGERHTIVASLRDGIEVVEATVRLKPDLVALAISMPRLSGIEAARIIKSELPETKVLFITRYSNPAYREAAFEAGAEGYVLKSDAPECILEAIDKLMAGETYLSPQFAGESPSESHLLSKSVRGGMTLTMRERMVLKQVAEGRASKEIAADLGISAKTVSFHRENIKRKLGVRSTAELTRFAMKLGLLILPEGE